MENVKKMYGTPEYEMFLNDPECSFGSNLDGNYKIDFKMDKCGTTVVQENGQLGTFQTIWSFLTTFDHWSFNQFDPNLTLNFQFSQIE